MRPFLAAIAISVAFCVSGWANYHAPVMHDPTWMPPKSQDRVVSIPLPTRPVRTETIKRPINHVALPWTCDTIREYAATHSRKELEARARERRLTKEQRKAALACIKEARK